MSLMSGSGAKAIVSLSKSYCCLYFKFLRFFGTQAYFFYDIPPQVFISVPASLLWEAIYYLENQNSV